MRSNVIGVALLCLAGCAVVESGPGIESQHLGYPGDIYFYWDFEGRGCAQVPDVARVQVTIQGSRGPLRLENDGVYRCNTAGVDGIRIEQLDPGSYTFWLQGLRLDGTALYTGGGTVLVNGDTTVRTTLVAAGRLGRVQLNWSILKDDAMGVRAAVACEAAGITGPDGVSRVAVTIDDASRTLYDCSTDGVQGQLLTLPIGTHQLTVEGLIPQTVSGQQLDATWYRGELALVVSDQLQTRTIQLYPVGAGATFLPVNPEGTRFSCTASNVTRLRVRLSDSHGHSSDDTVDCGDYEGRGFRWDYLVAGDSYDSSADRWRAAWTITVEGLGPAGDQLEARVSGTKTVQVYAGYADQTFPVPLAPK